jgi:hypothetical protein
MQIPGLVVVGGRYDLVARFPSKVSTAAGCMEAEQARRRDTRTDSFTVATLLPRFKNASARLPSAAQRAEPSLPLLPRSTTQSSCEAPAASTSEAIRTGGVTLPCPSPEQSKRIEANKLKNAKRKASMDALDARVQRIIDDALERVCSNPMTELPELPELLDKLDSAYMLAMATSQPRHAGAIVMSMAKLCGLDVNQHIVAGSPPQFNLQGDTRVTQAPQRHRTPRLMNAGSPPNKSPILSRHPDWAALRALFPTLRHKAYLAGGSYGLLAGHRHA